MSSTRRVPKPGPDQVGPDGGPGGCEGHRWVNTGQVGLHRFSRDAEMRGFPKSLSKRMFLFKLYAKCLDHKASRRCLIRFVLVFGLLPVLHLPKCEVMIVTSQQRWRREDKRKEVSISAYRRSLEKTRHATTLHIFTMYIYNIYTIIFETLKGSTCFLVSRQPPWFGVVCRHSLQSYPTCKHASQIYCLERGSQTRDKGTYGLNATNPNRSKRLKKGQVKVSYATRVQLLLPKYACKILWVILGELPRCFNGAMVRRMTRPSCDPSSNASRRPVEPRWSVVGTPALAFCDGACGLEELFVVGRGGTQEMDGEAPYASVNSMQILRVGSLEASKLQLGEPGFQSIQHFQHGVRCLCWWTATRFFPSFTRVEQRLLLKTIGPY